MILLFKYLTKTVHSSDILQITFELKSEPLSLEMIRSIIKQREQEKAFWKKTENEINKQNSDMES